MVAFAAGSGSGIALVTEYEESYFGGGPYSHYEDFSQHETRLRRIIALTHPKTVLDVGCAYGFMVRRLLKEGIDAHGCDISKWCQKQAETIIPGRYHLAPADCLPFPDKSIDTI